MNREDKIAKHLIEQGFLNGAEFVRVYDPSENATLYRGVIQSDALEAAKAVDEVGISFRKGSESLGAFYLVYGNGDDIISNFTDNPFCEKLWTNTTATFGLIQ